MNKNNSLLLPQFDTASIVNSDVENIILSLYVLNMGMDENTEVQLTINPINLKSQKKLNGISIFHRIQTNEYLNISLPRELFEKMIGTENRLFLKLVEPNASLIFAGVNSATTDPRLTIETTDVEKPNIPSIKVVGFVKTRKLLK